MRKTSCFKRRFMTKALILSIVLVIVWGSSSIVGASPRVDKQLGHEGDKTKCDKLSYSA